jgi:uncharacterized alpha/beta hydrolase family protein
MKKVHFIIIIIIIIIIIVIIIIITFMQGIYDDTLKTTMSVGYTIFQIFCSYNI